MIPERKAELVAALRSGKYTQGQSRLKTGNNFCCLGVASEISGLGKWEPSDSCVVPDTFSYVVGGDSCSHAMIVPVLNHYGLTGKQATTMSDWNDHDGLTFEQIADFIEREF